MTLDQPIEKANECLSQGKIIAYPTEAVFGLGCDPWNVDAVGRLLQLKRRSIEKGLILVASDFDQVASLVQSVPAQQFSRVLDSWPGPTTWLFPAAAKVPLWVRGQHATVAIRVSAHPVVQALCRAFSGPLISTSANIADHLPARSVVALKLAFGDQIDYIIDGALGDLQNPTEIRDVLTGVIVRQ